MHRGLRPPNYVSLVVDAGAEAMMAAERGQLPHHFILPHEPTTNKVGSLREKTSQLAGPVLVQGVHLVSVGDADDHTVVVQPDPRHSAARSAERLEIGD